ncbi:MAG: dynamin family protein [bacterium]|nr:dynamin family protein [bacterium]
MANQEYSDLQDFAQKQKDLAQMLNEASGIAEKLNMTGSQKNFAKLSDKINAETFKIMVMGRFKTGKSTFINSMLAEEVLPSFATPCTAIINLIKYGEDKQAELFFRDPLPAKLPSDLADRARKHIEQYRGRNVPPLIVDYNEIEDYVVIPMNEKEPEDNILESPYARVELTYPIELLRSNVEIIDSPGLNEDRTRTEVTMKYLPLVDAIIFLMDAPAACSEAEMSALKVDLHNNGFDDPFLVVNRMDLVRPAERERLKKFVNIKLNEFTKNKIYFVSALPALEARLNGDDSAYQESGMAALSEDLTEFLIHERGLRKLTAPAKQLRFLLSSDIRQSIERQRQGLEHSLDEVRQRYEDMQAKVRDIEKRRDQLQEKMTLRAERAGNNFRRCATDFTRDISAKIPVWVSECTPSQKRLASKSDCEKAAEEITDVISEHIKVEQQQWQKSVLAPLLGEKMQEICDAAESDFSGIFKDLDLINNSLSGNQAVSSFNVWERVSNISSDALTADIGTAIANASSGSMANAFTSGLFHAGAGLALKFLAGLNPVTLIVALGASFLASLFGGKNQNSQGSSFTPLKNAIIQQAQLNLAEGDRESSENISESLKNELKKFIDEAIEAINKELSDAQGQFESIKRTLEAGQQNVDAKKRQLKELQAQSERLDAKLNEFIFSLLQA